MIKPREPADPGHLAASPLPAGRRPLVEHLARSSARARRGSIRRAGCERLIWCGETRVVSRRRSAEEAAFEEFVRARTPAFARIAYLLTGDRHDAEDLVQTALARTATRWTRL